MLVLFSDIHLSDETTARNVPASAFDLLGATIGASAVKKKATEIHVVLLGDCLDLVRTDHWFASEGLGAGDRPWNGTLDGTTAINRAGTPRFHKVETTFQDVLGRILATPSSAGFVTMLKGLAGHDVPLHVTYVVGNHDRMLHNFPSLRQTLVTALEPEVTSVSFVPALQAAGAGQYGALARHGHEWDEHCHSFELYRRVLAKGSAVGRFDDSVYRVQTIGEVVTAELLSGFLWRMGKALKSGTKKDRALHDELKDVNNLRPISAVFSWLAWISQQPVAAKHLQRIRVALRESLEGVLDSSLATLWDKVRPDLIVSGDLTDYLAKLRLVLKQKNGLELLGQFLPAVDAYQTTRRLVTGGDELDELAKGAQHEFKHGAAATDVQYVFYGHTHDARTECFVARPDGKVKMYVNTGTFLPVIDRARHGSGFFSSHRMSYACVYRDDEDTDSRVAPGPTLDVWNGQRRRPSP